ncbi:MAG: phosphonate C-P lyase system protein PhnG [Clostridiales Family XIII bacterium]|jgi:alpha-D-ribose 1-methylphosphonate 5-triphosphate synthase subunit PhnG|nr:phosphonate C-P lyase system protein PhnG [Clostridiales Family XIII bacterium]
MLERKRMSKILFHMPKQSLLCIADEIKGRYPVRLVKDIERILIMANIEEGLRSTKFHLGEVLATEALVEMNGYRGSAVFMGDDEEKTLAAAIIDCGFNAGIEELALIEERLITLEAEYEKRMRAQAALIERSKVDFSRMSGGGSNA